MSRLPSRVIVLTAPVACASSVRRSTSGTTRSLCGIVTLAPRKSSVAQLGDRRRPARSGRGPTARSVASMPSESKAACCIAPDSEWATGWPIRTTRLVMLAPFRGRRRSRDRRWRPSRAARSIVSPAGDEAGDREGHREAVVVEAVGRGAVQGSRRRRSRRSSPSIVDPGAERAQARRRSRRSGPIPCGGARRRRGSRSCPRRRGRGEAEDRDLVDRRGHVGRPELDRRAASRSGRRGRPSARRRRRRAPAPRGRSSMSAPIERRMSMTARRVGLTPTSRSVSSASGWMAPATSQKAAAETSPGTRSSTACTAIPPSTVQATRPSGASVALDRHAPRPEHPLRVVARRDRLADRRPPVRSQPRQQDRRLHLRARHRASRCRSPGAGYDRPRSGEGGSRSGGRGARRPSSAVVR